jgi:lysylphosphatidylglycerol synthetase-like protein (DUF2156 family)
VTLAQFSTPSEGLATSYFLPLILAALLYAVLFVAARVLNGRGDPRADTAEDAGFALIVLSGVYVAILAVVALASEIDLIWDMVRILAIIVVFFAALILLLLVVFERGIGGISRLRRRG